MKKRVEIERFLTGVANKQSSAVSVSSISKKMGVGKSLIKNICAGPVNRIIENNRYFKDFERKDKYNHVFKNN